ncbi:MAG: septum site-determining protein MinC [Candidatus Methylophosphatis roskildensis]
MSSRELSTFELKSGAIAAFQLVIKVDDFDTLSGELTARYGSIPDFFADDPVAIDVRRLPDQAQLPLQALAALLESLRLKPIGVIASDAQQVWAGVAGLPRLMANERERRDTNAVASVEQAAQAVEPMIELLPLAAPTVATTIVDRPLRSGQRLYVEGDLVVLALVSHGAEVIAGGNIHIYAPLRGRALAGVRGNHQARIFCTCMEPELISIAGIYRTVETALPDDVQGKPAQVWLDGEKLVVAALDLR